MELVEVCPAVVMPIFSLNAIQNAFWTSFGYLTVNNFDQPEVPSDLVDYPTCTGKCHTILKS